MKNTLIFLAGFLALPALATGFFLCPKFVFGLILGGILLALLVQLGLIAVDEFGDR